MVVNVTVGVCMGYVQTALIKTKVSINNNSVPLSVSQAQWMVFKNKKKGKLPELTINQHFKV